jgi:lipoyl(octanoyl) transferase
MMSLEISAGQQQGFQLDCTPLSTEARRGCTVIRPGRVSYAEAAKLQSDLVARRKLNESSDVLLLLEHAPVITWGRNSRMDHLLSSPELLSSEGIELVQSNRGGDVTFHGPGQLVGYPIICLDGIRKDVVWYVRTLEEVLIRTLLDLGIESGRIKGMTGVWVEHRQRPAKVAAIGVHISRWVTSHGFALNINTDLRYFRHIVPCGIADHPVTSLHEVTGASVDRRTLDNSLIHHFGSLFGLVMAESSLQVESELLS